MKTYERLSKNKQKKLFFTMFKTQKKQKTLSFVWKISSFKSRKALAEE